jgi:hypothetical protein
MRSFWFAASLFLLAAPAAVGQTKISGTESCGQPSSQQALEVGDYPGHAMDIGQWHCTWTKPFEISGVHVKDDINTQSSDSRGNTAHVRGYSVGTMDDGDKFYVRFQGTLTLKEGVPQSGGGTWTFVSGTVKLKGLEGKGTWKEAMAEGVGITQIEGEYELSK